MDANKLKVLYDVLYKVEGTCGNCVHATFPQNDWGTCGLIQYEHQKHSGPPRQLSIYRYGSCLHHKMSDSERAKLGAYEEFVK